MVNLLESLGNMCNFSLNTFINLCIDSWIIDTGATSHITRDLSLFDIHDLKTPCIVILLNRTLLPISKVGQITL